MGTPRHAEEVWSQRVGSGLAGMQVICVAEGAGQETMEKMMGTDASGNPILADVGIFLRDKLKAAPQGGGPHMPVSRRARWASYSVRY